MTALTGFADPIRTAHDAILAAREITQAPEGNWLCVLYLDTNLCVLGAGVYGLQEGCPVQAPAQEMVAAARRYDTARMLTVRWMPTARPFRLTRALARATALQQASQAVGLPLRDYIVAWPSGTWFSFRECAGLTQDRPDAAAPTAWWLPPVWQLPGLAVMCQLGVDAHIA